jgi:RHS repeat-associated protein
VWDAKGRLAQRISDDPRSSWSFAYDGENRLVEAQSADGYRLRYTYDAFGRRLAIVRNDGSSTFFGWSGDAMVEEVDSAGRAARRVFWDDGYTPLLDFASDAGWRLVATDCASTPWLYLGADGSIDALDLGPTGREVMAEGRPGLLRFAGQRADRETGLYYNRHRYYSPELGTFLTPDPLGLNGSVQDIGFVPNTTEYLDPLGLVIIIGFADAETIQSAYARGDATKQDVIFANQLYDKDTNPHGISLKGESHVEIVAHGSQDGGDIKFESGGKRWNNGQAVGQGLKNAGLNSGTEVVVVACNASMTPTRKPKQSVIAGINQATGNPTSGPSGVTYVRPYKAASPGPKGSVDLTGGQWDQATGPMGGTPKVTKVDKPSTQHRESW